MTLMGLMFFRGTGAGDGKFPWELLLWIAIAMAVISFIAWGGQKQ